ncbi:MAG: glycoside hydrolase family 3 N-terminal domain-containing protein [Sphingomonas sp.]|uniref:glycoside hydrolase family 3 protein n=1 Tax=Sphingomonas sp. TaxID=28214 RepID=UPI003F7F2541
MRRFLPLMALAGASALAVAAFGQSAPDSAGIAHPARWPIAKSRGLIDPATEARITALMARMTIEEKVGQMIQADISDIKPEDLRKYPLGSILAGGSSPPLGSPDRSPQGPWIATSRAFNAVADERRPGHVVIPLMFGIDAVHGNNNVIGATLFPHNIGLGAANDPALMTRIGRATAEETAVAGIDWAFGPTLAVPQDDRWGRTYEGYSEDPSITARYAGAMVLGLQGAPGKGRIQAGYVAASAKHFLGDGGTWGGIDQGDDRIDEATLIRIHAAGYPPAIDAGVKTVMASFSSWNGVKMHGNKSLLTGVLKGRMGFAGFVVGDWNGHGQVPGCTKSDCPAAFNAGLDMAMAPDGWRDLFDNTVKEAKSGAIPMSRINDAVRRILRVKFAMGLFDPARPWEGRAGVLGSPAHRAIAREAVAKSLVLLKNDGVLPLKASANVLVAGPGADSIPMQAGGWTLSWQGDGNSNADFPGAQSIYAGIAAAIKAGGGRATLSPDGSFDKSKGKPDVAIVVFGEHPYAEMRGDLKTLEFEPGDKAALALLRKLRAAGIPTVSVFLSGRPLWVNPEINQSDAFVAAWLPGSEGEGVADVIVGTRDGRPRKDFTGRLSYSWPRNAGQFANNRGMKGYDPLFAFGYGLSYAKGGRVGVLDEAPGFDASGANASVFFAKGQPAAPFAFGAGPILRRAVDGPQTQEGAVALLWPAGGATLTIEAPAPIDLTREANADVVLKLTYRLDAGAAGPVSMAMGGSRPISLNGMLKAGGWQMLRVPLKCFAAKGARMEAVKEMVALSAGAGFAVSVADVRLDAGVAGDGCAVKD